ncbi:MAG: glycosyltransferase family 39 protein [Chitinophagales bacterium]
MVELEMNNKRKPVGVFLFYGFLFIYFAGLIFLCRELNVSVDEIFSLNTTSGGLSGAIKLAYNSEGQPPVYFALLSLWRYINSDILFTRLFSVLFIVLSAYIFYRLIRLISKPDYIGWLMLVFLLNPFTIWAATEIRLYAFLLFLSLTSLFFFFRFYLEGKNRYLFFFVLIGIVGIFTQYLYVFLFFALGFALLLFKGWKTFFKFCLISLPAAALFLVNYLSTSDPMKYAQVNSLSTTLSERFSTVLHSPQNLILVMNQVPFGRALRLVITGIFIVLAVYAYLKWYKERKTTRQPSFEVMNVVLMSSFSLVALFSIFFSFTAVDYHEKYIASAFPFLILVVLLFEIFPPVTAKVIFGAIALFYVSVLFSIYRYPVKDYDNRSLAKYITSIEDKGEPIFFYQKTLSLPFKIYYTGNNPVVPIPDDVAFDSTYFSKIKDTVELRRSIERIKTDSPTILLITDRNEAAFKENEDVKILNTYLAEHYNVALDTFYHGQGKKNYSLRVRRLEKKEKN